MMQILEVVLKRLNTTVETAEINRGITRVGDLIKEYCCLGVIPESLFPLWADMVYDLIFKEGTGESGAFTGLSSISMGDVSYGFNRGKNGKDVAEALLGDYKQRLNKARKGLFR
ncbi:MAG: hypothetical protein RSC20_00530 [Clostridiales bacterium]